MLPAHSSWLVEPEFRTVLLSIPQSGIPSALTSSFSSWSLKCFWGSMGRSGPGSKTHPSHNKVAGLSHSLRQDSSRERVLFFLKTKEYWPGIRSRSAGLAVEPLRDYRALLQSRNFHSPQTHQGCSILALPSVPSDEGLGTPDLQGPLGPASPS